MLRILAPTGGEWFKLPAFEAVTDTNNSVGGLFPPQMMERTRRGGAGTQPKPDRCRGRAAGRPGSAGDERERALIRRGALAAALILQLTTGAPAADAACKEDVGDLERVVPTLTMPTDLRREGEALQSQAGLLCEGGDEAGASGRIKEAWEKILASDEVTARTVAELATDTCTEGVATVRREVDGTTEVGEMGLEMARLLIEDAVQLCSEDEEMLAEEKLSLAMAILTDEEE